MSKNKNRKKNRQNLRTMANIAEGERIYRQLAAALLSAHPTVGGAVAMTYALGKANVNVKKALALISIDAEEALEETEEKWDGLLEVEYLDDQIPFDDYALSIIND